jgi:hypothetical protein
MTTGPETETTRVYAPSRWPLRSVAAVFVAIGVVGFAVYGVVLPLVFFGGMGGLIAWAAERTKVQVSSRGVTSVPPFGQPRSFPWSDIDGFVAQQIAPGYGGWMVAMSVRDEWVPLNGTRRGWGFKGRSRRAVEGLAEELNAERRRAQRGAR